MKKIINARIVNEGEIFLGDILIDGENIAKIISKKNITKNTKEEGIEIIDAKGKFLIPGVIDDHVHFREPGLTKKADIYTESKAAVAGGVTSFMEMPNTIPQSITNSLLEEKFDIASKKSLANYSFYFGATNDNIDELLKVDPKNVCGIKVFMGASTGNMLVDDSGTLENIFSKSKMLVAIHSEDEEIIQKNIKIFKEKYGEDVPIKFHPEIRSEEACYKSTEIAVKLAKKHGTRLHILHLSTSREMELFDNSISLKDKKITSEVCVHHLWFDENDYEKYGTLIKWNPAIKSPKDKSALFEALLNDKLDIVATDHAPHLLEEKKQTYFKAPSGGPLVQHSLPLMLEFYHDKKISIEKIVEKMCHAPAVCFNVEKRGFIREGYKADLVLVNTNATWKVDKSNILYKCGWSPFENYLFRSKITHTFVNGNLVFDEGCFDENIRGQRLKFDR